MPADLQMIRVRRKQREVLWAVVLLVAVAMMHDLGPTQRTPEDCFHDDDVLSHVAVEVGSVVIRPQHQSVPILDNERLATTQRITALRAEARPVGASSPDHDRCAAESAHTGHTTDHTGHTWYGLATTLPRTIEPPTRQALAVWAMHPRAAARAHGIVFQQTPMLAACGCASLTSFCGDQAVMIRATLTAVRLRIQSKPGRIDRELRSTPGARHLHHVAHITISGSSTTTGI